jgi:hypothetical protein
MAGRKANEISARGRSAAGEASHGVDRMVRNVETGRFERSLSALTAAGALAVVHGE